HRIDRHDIAVFGAVEGLAERRPDADDIPAVRLRLQTDVGAVVAHAADEVSGWRDWYAGERVVETRGEDALVVAEDDDLGSGGGTPLLIEACLDLHARADRERACEQLGAPRAFLHAQVERRAREHQRVLQALAHLHPKTT